MILSLKLLINRDKWLNIIKRKKNEQFKNIKINDYDEKIQILFDIR